MLSLTDLKKESEIIGSSIGIIVGLFLLKTGSRFKGDTPYYFACIVRGYSPSFANRR
jgi:hypothetical protein